MKSLITTLLVLIFAAPALAQQVDIRSTPPQRERQDFVTPGPYYDITQPREIGYYKPPVTRISVDRNSSLAQSGLTLPALTADSVMVPAFRDNGKEIWFNSSLNGVQVVRFSERFVAANPVLFKK